MSNQIIKHVKLYEKVIEQIEKMYEEGTLNIGDTLPPERELASKYSVSRGTLRDAFRVLEFQGIIETKPGGGRILKNEFNQNEDGASILSELQKSEMLDLLETRETLESGMIKYVCERATDEDIKKLESLVMINSDSPKYIEKENLDYYFHHAVAECTKNMAMLNFMKLNLEIINKTRQKNFMKLSNFEEAQKEHYEIVQAIKKQDSMLAQQKISEHFNNIRSRLNNR